MNKIDIKTIDFDRLFPLKDIMSTESKIYVHNKKLYKLYKNIPEWKLEKKRTKMYMLEGYDLPNVIIPTEQITKNNKLVGCSESYIPSTALYDFSKKCEDVNLFLNIVLYECSENTFA